MEKVRARWGQASGTAAPCGNGFHQTPPSFGGFRTKQIPQPEKHKKGELILPLGDLKGGHVFRIFLFVFFLGLYICPNFSDISHVSQSSRKCGWKCRSVRCEELGERETWMGGGKARNLQKKPHIKNPQVAPQLQGFF